MATGQKRIYAVKTASGKRLVEAANKAQAINHVARDTITAEVAQQGILIALTKAGIEVEVAGELAKS
jgi:hypothetical protein